MLSKIESGYVEGLKSIIMNEESDKGQLQEAITDLGMELGKKIIEDFFLHLRTFNTPMGVEVSRKIPELPLCAIVTTKDDFSFLGKGISNQIKSSIIGYMDFEGIRGIQALNSEIRHLELPKYKGDVNTLIIGKAVLATGCTAIHLAKTAISRCLPRNVIICSVFFTEQAIAELKRELPNANIIVAGCPDQINEDGMLIPGIGNLDLRLCA